MGVCIHVADRMVRVTNVNKTVHGRYGYAMTVLRGLVKTDFKLRYQGSFLGIAWSVLKPLMLFVVMYFVFAKFLRIDDGTPTYPVVLLCGVVSWQFVTETVTMGLRSIVDRGDLLRKVHFPNVIVVVSASLGALISLGINYVVVLVFAFFSHVQFTWRVLLFPLSVLQLYVLALSIAMICATCYVYFRDIAHIWDVLQQVLFYAMPIMYPLTYVLQKGGIYAQLVRFELLNPIAQAIQDIRCNLLAPTTTPTVWSLFSSPWPKAFPLVVTVLLAWFGVWLFRRNSSKFAEVM